MTTEYHLIFGQFIRKSTCLTVIGFFAVKFNYLTTNCLFCSAFEYKNSTLIPKSFVKHQKLKENHKKTQAFSQKTQGKTQKLKNPPTRVKVSKIWPKQPAYAFGETLVLTKDFTCKSKDFPSIKPGKSGVD